MEIVNIPPPKGKVLTYNEANPFTRRNPTFLTKKQQERDSKIARQIIHAYDVEEDKQKVMKICLFFPLGRCIGFSLCCQTG